MFNNIPFPAQQLSKNSQLSLYGHPHFTFGIKIKIHEKRTIKIIEDYPIPPGRVVFNQIICKAGSLIIVSEYEEGMIVRGGKGFFDFFSAFGIVVVIAFYLIEQGCKAKNKQEGNESELDFFDNSSALWLL